MNPDDLGYTAEHEWVRDLDGARVRVGITDFAQHSLGEIVYVQFPEVGEDVEAGTPMGELESTKDVSDIFAPVTGRIVARNDDLDSSPDLCNSDPYGDGWIVEIEMSDPAELDTLLNAAEYEAGVTSS